MKRNPNPPRMFCSFFFFLTFTLPHSLINTHRERREKRDGCAIALIANKGAAIQGGVGWGGGKGKERKGIHTHTRMAMDGWMRCAAMEWKWVGILLLLFLLSSCFLLFKERARA